MNKKNDKFLLRVQNISMTEKSLKAFSIASVTVLSVLGIILNAIMLISICFVIYALAVEAAGHATREVLSSALMKG